MPFERAATLVCVVSCAISDPIAFSLPEIFVKLFTRVSAPASNIFPAHLP